MGYTRRQFIDLALEELGLASYAFDIPPERLESSMRRLDAMLAGWNAKGIRLGYPIPSAPGGGNLADETNVPDRAYTAIIANLAVQLAPSWGKTPMPETKAAARNGYELLLVDAAQPIEIRPMVTVAGAGHKSDYPFTFAVPDNIVGKLELYNG